MSKFDLIININIIVNNRIDFKMRQKFKFDSTEDAVKRLKNQFKDFNLESYPLFMEINSKRVVGNQYNEVAIFLSKSSEESFLYIYNTYVKADGSLSSDDLLIKSRFKNLNELYKTCLNVPEKELFPIYQKIYKNMKNSLIERNYNNFNAQLSEKTNNKKVKL